MEREASFLDRFIIASGYWLTKRRGILLTPLFAVALLSARWALTPLGEALKDLLGIAFLTGGTWLRLVAASYHEGAHPSEPISAGPYAWVRHPLYLANFLLGFGIVLVAGWWPMVAVYVLLFLPVHFLIARSEELHLRSLYGEKYDAYRRVVPAIIPWRPFRGPRSGTSSSFKLKKGQEWLKVAGYAAGMASILLFKQWRQEFGATLYLPHLSLQGGVIAVCAAVLALIYRPKIRWAWLRAFQTAIAVFCILLLAAQIPGLWKLDRTPLSETTTTLHRIKTATIGKPVAEAPDGLATTSTARITNNITR